jgi:hypothetical protein
VSKAVLPRKGRALPLGQPLSEESSLRAEHFLNRSGWATMGQGGSFRDYPQGGGVRYELAIRATSSGWKVWSTVEGHVFPNDPCRGITFERYASAPSRDMLKRKLERCILDAWAEIERRSHLALLAAACEYAQGTPWFAEAVEQQEALWGASDYQSMTVEVARKWRAWVDSFIDNKLALPPSRQLAQYTGPFQLHFGALVIYEGQTAFWIMVDDSGEGGGGRERCMGDMVDSYSNDGAEALPVGSPEFYEALSHDFVTNNATFWAAYFPEELAQKVFCPKCGEEVWDVAGPDQSLNKCWNCKHRFENEGQ